MSACSMMLGAAVVAGEQNQGVVRKPVVSQGLRNSGNAAIERTQHGGIHPQAVLFNMRQRFIVFPASLQRVVRTPVRKVEEEGASSVGLDDLQRPRQCSSRSGISRVRTPRCR